MFFKAPQRFRTAAPVTRLENYLAGSLYETDASSGFDSKSLSDSGGNDDLTLGRHTTCLHVGPPKGYLTSERR